MPFGWNYPLLQLFALKWSFAVMLFVCRFYHGKISYIFEKRVLLPFYSTHFPQIYLFPSLPFVHYQSKNKIRYNKNNMETSMEIPFSYIENYIYANSIYGNICDSLTTIISKSSHRNLLKLCQMAIFNVFVLCFWRGNWSTTFIGGNMINV